MSSLELIELAQILRILYKNGFIEWLANIHSNHWPVTHKTVIFEPFHNQLRLVLEKEIQKYNPNIALPYWVRINVLRHGIQNI